MFLHILHPNHREAFREDGGEYGDNAELDLASMEAIYGETTY